jgi:hypothetical protein
LFSDERYPNLRRDILIKMVLRFYLTMWICPLDDQYHQVSYHSCLTDDHLDLCLRLAITCKNSQN